uniref:AlNc14C28G2717 protein n=1 Tax=Albugo laibachii Nc14 TaxID=890382 RepID=F0W795_9STRA|nr:AlNc14C28G2717 [Albugo laibachii Nc14]|eukprot:CCA16994.1 AlNc14C28G2717 [Albugo laibachii Nc14]
MFAILTHWDGHKSKRYRQKEDYISTLHIQSACFRVFLSSLQSDPVKLPLHLFI